MKRRDDPQKIQLASMPSPLGRIWLAASEAGALAIALGESRSSFRAWLAARHASARPVDGEEWLSPLKDWLSTYFRGERPSPERVRRAPAQSPFQRRVWDELARLPYGAIITYGDLARRVGCASARAVGQAMGRNPLPILVPCHRVIAAGGGLGGYSGGIEVKRYLLAFEGFRVDGTSTHIERED